MTKKEKVLEFIKTHKKTICLTVLSIGGVIVAGTIINKTPKILEDIGLSCCDLETPELAVGTLDEFWKEGGCVNAIVNDIKVNDLGRFGEELVKKVDFIKPDTEVSAIMGFLEAQES